MPGGTVMAKLLLLDDDPEIRSMVEDALTQEGYDVTTADAIDVAREVAGRQDFEVYVLDVKLPDGNGLKFAREVRERSNAGIILLTGLGDETDRVLGLEFGADDYVVKPFLLREFRARVNAVYRRVNSTGSAHAPMIGTAAPSPETRSFSFHDWVLNTASRTITDATGQSLELTTLEFDVLRVLAANPNRVLSRDQIMDQVKGANWAAYDRSIDGLVSRLRRKLFPDGSGASKIKTIRNVGYMLAV